MQIENFESLWWQLSLLWLESNKVFDNQSYTFIYAWKKINSTGQILRIVCYPIAQWNRFQPLNWKNVKCFLSQSPKIKLRNMNWNIRWHLGSMYLHYTNGRNGEQNNSNCGVSCQIWKLSNWNNITWIYILKDDNSENEVLLIHIYFKS